MFGLARPFNHIYLYPKFHEPGSSHDIYLHEQPKRDRFSIMGGAPLNIKIFKIYFLLVGEDQILKWLILTLPTETGAISSTGNVLT